MTKEQEGAFRGDGYVHFLGGGDGVMGVYVCQAYQRTLNAGNSSCGKYTSIEQPLTKFKKPGLWSFLFHNFNFDIALNA